MNRPDTLEEIGSYETPGQLHWLRFAHDGRLLLGGGYDALVRRWDFSESVPTEISPIRGFHGWVDAFALHPGQPLLYAADSWGRLACYQYDGKTAAIQWEHSSAHEGWIRTLSITPDGKQLASAGNDRCIRVFDTADGTLRHEIPAGQDDIFAIAIHPEGKTVVSGDVFCTLKVWDLTTAKCVREFDAKKMHFHDRDQDVCGLRVLGFRDGGATLLAAGAEPTQTGRGHGIPVIYMFDWAMGKITRRLKQGNANDGFIDDLVTHPNGFFMTVTTGQPGKGKLLFHQPEQTHPLVEYTKMSNTHSIALHPGGEQFVVAATNRRSQGNGAVTDAEGRYVGNYSPLHVFKIPERATLDQSSGSQAE